MNFKNIRWKNLILLSVVVVALQTILTFVYRYLPGVGTTQNLFSITPQTALTSTSIGDKLIGLLSGIIPFSFDIMTIISMLIGTFALLTLGYIVIDKLPRSIQGNNKFQRTGIILLLGTAILYVVLLVTKMGSVPSITTGLAIGLLVNYALIAAGIYLIEKNKTASRLISV
jgi:hypothetical protein